MYIKNECNNAVSSILVRPRLRLLDVEKKIKLVEAAAQKIEKSSKGCVVHVGVTSNYANRMNTYDLETLGGEAAITDEETE